jgi:hypothetical protein
MESHKANSLEYVKIDITVMAFRLDVNYWWV